MNSTATPSTTARFARIDRNATVVIATLLAISALLVVPFLAMAPTESASTEPTGDVFTARDRVDDTFVSSVHASFFIVDHEDGDLLRAEPLRELLAAQDALRADDEYAQFLFTYYDAEAERDVTGVVNLSELVRDELLAEGIALTAATDTDVEAAGTAVIERFGERSEVLGLSPESELAADGTWIVPALAFPVLSDDTQLGFGNTSINFGGGTEAEEYDRGVQDILRTAESFQVNGVAIDVNLTSEEQGAVAGPFIGFTMLAVLAIVGLTFRSYWVLAVVSSAFLLLIIWLKGISNLIGLEDDLVLSLIVPIAMISFGIDFAFHAIGRYREERATGLPSRAAFVTGSAAVSGALLLALASDTTAFLANLTSGIESINQFGLGAAIALASAYVLLGVATPLVLARIESAVRPPSTGRRSTVLRVAAGLAAASMTMAAALFLVFLLPVAGVVLTVVTILSTVAVPVLVRRRRDANEPAVGDLPLDHAESAMAGRIGRAIAAPTRRPVTVVALAAVVTGLAVVPATRVPAEFDVEDYFSSDTDFVVSLDQLDEHVGERGGEPALVYVEGDLTDPAALAAISARLAEVRALDTPSLARDETGVMIDGGVFEVFESTWASPVMVGIVAEATGVELTDADGDGIPDSRAQVTALLAVATEIGVPLGAERVLLTPDDVNTAVRLDVEPAATVFELGLVDSRAQESVAAAKADLEPIAEALAADLDGTFVQVTGSPFVREASLDATNRALQISLPVAMMACLVIATVFLRSIRFGLASIIPIVMVVAWLYAFMYISGFAINLVTATIAAVSIGIGIDFAIHFIVRYREELARTGGRHLAVRAAGEGTGLALVASAISSAVGFAILALAPMPLFAAYGLLTALMIVMALIATLAVLPSVLVLISRDARVTEPMPEVEAPEHDRTPVLV